MHEDRTAARDERAATGRDGAPESLTPLNAAAAWAILVHGTVLWPALAPLSAKLAYVGGVIVLAIAVHLIHEAGHVLAGLAVGLPFRSVTVGLFTLRREPRGGARLTFDVNRSWKRLGGCVEREVVPAPGLRRALTVAAVGGPLASIAGGALLLAAAPPAYAALAEMSLFVGLFNAVPTALLGQPSDGMIVYRLWSRRPAAVEWRTQICGAG